MAKQLSTLAALKGAGAVLASAPKQTEVTWKNDAGEEFTFTVLIKPMSFGAALEFGKGADHKETAQAISSLVLFDDGEGGHASLSYEDALNLHPALGWSLFAAISKGFTKKK